MFCGKEVRIILKGQAKESFLELKKRDDKEAQSLLRSIDRIISILKSNPQYGDPIRKELIPNSFKKIGIQNLYRRNYQTFGECSMQLKEIKWKSFVLY